MKLLYLSGPYSGDIDKNISLARAIAQELWREGHFVLCPHTNSGHFTNIPYEHSMDGYLYMLPRCDYIVMLPHWQESPGACREYELALEIGMPILYYPDVPDPVTLEAWTCGVVARD